MPRSPQVFRSSPVRTIAVVCLFFGPTLAGMAILSWGASHLVHTLENQMGTRLHVSAFEQLLLDYSERALPYLLVASLIFTVVGVLGFREGERGRRALVVGAWASIGATVILAGVWSQAVMSVGLGWPFHAAGIGLHAVQAYFIYRAVVVLRGFGPRTEPEHSK